jgi:hypothetical protein
MTGSDPVLNRRIVSIYINEFEILRNAILDLPQAENTDNIIAALNKIKPGMVIFEHADILPQFEVLISRKKNNETISPEDSQMEEILRLTETNLNHLKNYLKSIH